VHFISGDVFKPEVLQLAPPSYAMPSASPPPLADVSLLTPLTHHVTVIHASAFFHLFSEEQQERLARLLAGLLSPRPGALIFGSHIGLPEKGFKPKNETLAGRDVFCHSPRTWQNLWDGCAFRKGTVEVHAELSDVLRDGGDTGPGTDGDQAFPDNAESWRGTRWLTWSVRRM
jgi:hypothetical protein